MKNILVIEDNVDHYSLVEDALSEGFSNEVKIHHALEFMEGMRAIKEQSFDVCLCDLSYPDSPMADTIEYIKAMDCDTPIVILTSLNSVEVAKELLQHNIQDYIPKEEIFPALLYRICIYAIERKEQQLLMQSRNMDMKTFCASLSHDFKAHLRRMHQIIGILRDDLNQKIEFSPKEARWFDLVEENSAAIQDLVEGLGQFLRADNSEMKLERVDLFTLLRSLSDTIIDTYEDQVDISVDSKLATIRGNEAQLKILFHNLITNGIKFNRGQPCIELMGRLSNTSGYYEVLVKDNGIGIEDKYFSDIFIPFRRLFRASEFKGTGLGLSIVKRIVDKHSGYIRLESEMNKGSTFIIGLLL